MRADVDPSSHVAQAQATMRGSAAALADSHREIEGGWLVRTRSLRRVWSLNHVHLTAPRDGAAVAATAEEHQSDLDFRFVVCDFDAEAMGVLGALGPYGWQFGRELLMVATAPTGRGGSSVVATLTEAQMLHTMRRWLVEDREDISEVGLDEVVEYNRREGAHWHELSLGVLDDAGNPAALAKLRRDGDLGWIADVYTAPEARGRGHARTLLADATRRAFDGGAAAVFIVADDEDWPKELYASIGFTGVATTHTLRLQHSAA